MIDKIEIAKAIPSFWDALTEEQREQFVNGLEVRRYIESEIVFHEGDVATHTFFVYKGRVKMEVLGLDNKQHIISMAAPHNLFAIQAPFDKGVHNSTATVTEDAIIASLPNEQVNQFVTSNPKLANLYIGMLSNRIDTLVRRIQNLQRKHVRGKMADMLLYLRDKCGYEEDGKTIQAYPSRKEIANAAYMDISNAIRTLSAFVSEGVIAIDGRRYTILDEEKLKWISLKE